MRRNNRQPTNSSFSSSSNNVNNINSINVPASSSSSANNINSSYLIDTPPVSSNNINSTNSFLLNHSPFGSPLSANGNGGMVTSAVSNRRFNAASSISTPPFMVNSKIQMSKTNNESASSSFLSSPILFHHPSNCQTDGGPIRISSPPPPQENNQQPLGMTDRLRRRCQNLAIDHMDYSFWAELLSASSTAQQDWWDTIELANSYYVREEYHRSLFHLERAHELWSARGGEGIGHLRILYQSVICLIKLGQFEEALACYPPLPEGNEAAEKSPIKSHTRLLELFESFDTTGGTKEFALSPERIRSIKSRLFYERGRIEQHFNNHSRAVECYICSLVTDVTSFKAFYALTDQHLLSWADEQVLFHEVLPFDNQLGEDALEADTLRQLYSLRMGQRSTDSGASGGILNSALQYRLEDLDCLMGPVQLAQAESLYLSCKYEAAFALCHNVLMAQDPFNVRVLILEILLLSQLGKVNMLFQLCHRLNHSKEYNNSASSSGPILLDYNSSNGALAPFAIAMYYYGLGRWEVSRRYFSKATLIDPLFGPAWLGFGNAFARDGEHDQAISAYSTSARIYRGSHLPFLYIGMEHICTNNFSLAEQYLNESLRMINGSNDSISSGICEGIDPSVYLELGVVHYYQGNLDLSLESLKHAARRLLLIQHPNEICLELINTLWINLGHLLRRLERKYEAALCFHALMENPLNYIIISGDGESVTSCLPDCNLIDESLHLISALNLGLLYHSMGQVSIAVEYYHKALSINPEDSSLLNLMSAAVEHSALNFEASQNVLKKHSPRRGEISSLVKELLL